MSVCCVQYVGMYEDEEFGGMHGTLKSLVNADPNFGETQLLIITKNNNFYFSSKLITDFNPCHERYYTSKSSTVVHILIL